MSPLVPIIMGSKSDLDHGRAVADALADLGITGEIRVASAHKAAAYLLEILATYEDDPRPKVYITIAGRSNALSGLVDGNVVAPVIACPPYSARFGGSDIYSSLRMPSGIAPGVVLDPAGAALLAGKILGLVDATIQARVRTVRQAATTALISDDQAMPRE